MLVVFHPLVAHAKRQGAQRPRFRQVLGDPGAVRAQGTCEILDQGHEEPLPDLTGRPLEDHAESCLILAPLRHHRMWRAAWSHDIMTRNRSRADWLVHRTQGTVVPLEPPG